MFTGLIEAVCTVKKVSASQIAVELADLAKDAKIGDSVAINGVCLTVARFEGKVAIFDVSGETVSRTNLAKLTPGSYVNVELALKPSDRFGGHFVQGHIDGTATIEKIDRDGNFRRIRFGAAQSLLEQMVAKGSVAVDGTSLTIADLDEKGFTVAVIPQTLEQTTLSRAKVGDTVNIETDIICKAVKKQLDNILPRREGLTAERLRQLGF